MWSISVILVYFSFSNACGPNLIENYFKPCKSSDPNLNECIKEILNKIQPYAATGAPDINLKSVENFSVGKIDVVTASNSFIKLNGSLENVVINGLSNYHVSNVSGSLNVIHI